MFLLFPLNFVQFPDRKDGLLSTSDIKPEIDSSGSLGLYYNGKCHLTYPNLTLSGDKKYDWCSNVVRDKNDFPWISFNVPNKIMKLKGYAVRNGCCYYPCCCDPKTGDYIDGRCCCDLYSYSLQGSNDNKHWTVIHSITKNDDRIHHCEYKLYEFPLTQPYKFIRFSLDEEKPGCLKCLQINQIELYGETFQEFTQIDEDENQESISIIGKLKKY